MGSTANALTVVAKAEFQAVGFVCTGTFEEMDRIGQAWDAFAQHRHLISHWTDEQVALGISYDRPPKDYTYYAAAPVSAVAVIPAGMTAVTVPAGTYAIFTHKGSLDALGVTYGHIYREALPNAGRERDWSAPVLEVYGAKFNPTSPESEFDIYVPLA